MKKITEMKKTILILVISLISFALQAQERSDTIHVAHYDIHLAIVDFAGKVLQGNAILDVVPKVAQLDNIVLDLAAFTVDSVKINGNMASFQHHSPVLTIALSTPSMINDTIKVAVYYHGVPEENSSWGGGVYFSGEYAYNIGVTMSRIPHSYGRAWYPCIDLFTDKSTYSYRIRTTPNKMAVCGGLLTDTSHLDNGDIIWHWELAQPIPTYLSSFAVGAYSVYRYTIQGIQKRIPVAIYTPPSLLSKVPGSFANLDTVLTHYEELFGPYRFDRVGYVGINFTAGAMEHATNIGYPNAVINGNLTYQSLLVHELSHSWFGNLYTCDKAEEMWLNEGFARYCEILTDEYLYHNDNPETDPAKKGFRDLHRKVLKSAHTDDGGYFALNHIPQEVTYGTTTYDKGGIIVHTLRNYLGDTLFFTGFKALFNEYAFKNLNSVQLFAFLSQTTGVNLTDFFEAFVNQPGFLHYAIDSIRLFQAPNHYKIYLKQKLHQAIHFGNSNRLEITFFGSNDALHTEKVTFSGEHGIADVSIPFQPIFGVVDFYEKMADAIIDYNLTINRTGNNNCAQADFIITTNEISDEAFVRVEHNLVAPDPLKRENSDIYRISDNHYWRIEYLPQGSFNGTFQFKYSLSNANNLDNELLQGYTVDDLVLLYRRDASEDWRMISFQRTGTAVTGYLKTTQFLPGEYVLAIGHYNVGIIAPKKNELKLYPNPAKTELHYQLPDSDFSKIEILDVSGKLIQSAKVKGNTGMVNISHLPTGVYYIRFTGKEKQLTERFIKTSH